MLLGVTTGLVFDERRQWGLPPDRTASPVGDEEGQAHARVPLPNRATPGRQRDPDIPASRQLGAARLCTHGVVSLWPSPRPDSRVLGPGQ